MRAERGHDLERLEPRARRAMTDAGPAPGVGDGRTPIVDAASIVAGARTSTPVMPSPLLAAAIGALHPVAGLSRKPTRFFRRPTHLPNFELGLTTHARCRNESQDDARLGRLARTPLGTWIAWIALRSACALDISAQALIGRFAYGPVHAPTHYRRPCPHALCHPRHDPHTPSGSLCTQGSPPPSA